MFDNISQPTTEAEDDDDFDFDRSVYVSGLPPLESQPDIKYFYLQLAGVEKAVQATKFTKERRGSVYSKVGRALLLEEGSYSIEYRLRRKSGKTETITLNYNADVELLEEGSELLYLQARSNDTLIVNRLKKEKRQARPKRKSEIVFPKFSEWLGFANRKAYKALATDQNQIEKYLKLLSYVRVILGNPTASNLLNPSDFLCPVSSCAAKVALGSYNKFTLAHRHLTTHKLNNITVATLLCDRISFLDNNKWFLKTAAEKTTEEMITMIEEGKPELSLTGKKLKIVCWGEKFRYSERCLDETILKDILQNNFSRLDTITDHQTIGQTLGLEDEEDADNEHAEQGGSAGGSANNEVNEVSDSDSDSDGETSGEGEEEQ